MGSITGVPLLCPTDVRIALGETSNRGAGGSDTAGRSSPAADPVGCWPHPCPQGALLRSAAGADGFGSEADAGRGRLRGCGRGCGRRLCASAARDVAERGGLQRGPGVAGRAVRLGSVTVDGVLGGGRGVAGSEVGAVAAEDLDPLGTRLVEVVGDQVRDVEVAAAGHPDVGRGGAGGLADQQVGVVDGLALGAVDGGGVGELDVLAHVAGGQGPLARASVHPKATVAIGAGDRPGVAVGHVQVAVVAAGGDPVPDADLLSGLGGERRGDRVVTVRWRVGWW